MLEDWDDKHVELFIRKVFCKQKIPLLLSLIKFPQHKELIKATSYQVERMN